MIQKKVLTNIISKYYLNGNVEKVTWVCKKEENSNTLTLNFINDARTFIGKLYCDKNGRKVRLHRGKPRKREDQNNNRETFFLYFCSLHAIVIKI